MRGYTTTILTGWALLLISFSGPTIAVDYVNKPNVVIMMVDNLGWGEIGVYGGGELRGAATPRLDKLASEGGWKTSTLNLSAHRLARRL